MLRRMSRILLLSLLLASGARAKCKPRAMQFVIDKKLGPQEYGGREVIVLAGHWMLRQYVVLQTRVVDRFQGTGMASLMVCEEGHQKAVVAGFEKDVLVVSEAPPKK
jgi:hypothetical protein